MAAFKVTVLLGALLGLAGGNSTIPSESPSLSSSANNTSLSPTRSPTPSTNQVWPVMFRQVLVTENIGEAVVSKWAEERAAKGSPVMVQIHPFDRTEMLKCQLWSSVDTFVAATIPFGVHFTQGLDQGLFLNLSATAYRFEDSLLHPLFGRFGYDTNHDLRGLPVSAFVSGLFLNRPLFEEVGALQPDQGHFKDLDHLETACQLLKKQKDTPCLIVSLFPKPWHAAQLLFAMMESMHGMSFMKRVFSGVMSWEDARVVETFRRFRDWADKGYFLVPPKFFNSAKSKAGSKIAAREAGGIYAFNKWDLTDNREDVEWMAFPGSSEDVIQTSLVMAVATSATFLDVSLKLVDRMRNEETNGADKVRISLTQDAEAVYPVQKAIVGWVENHIDGKTFPAFEDTTPNEFRLDVLKNFLVYLVNNETEVTLHKASGREESVELQAFLHGCETLRERLFENRVDTPTVTPLPGAFTEKPTLKLTTISPGSVIHYTLDGSYPTDLSPTLDAGGILLHKTTTLRAIAMKFGSNDSRLLEAFFDLTAIDHISFEADKNLRLAFARISTLLAFLPAGLGVWVFANRGEKVLLAASFRLCNINLALGSLSLCAMWLWSIYPDVHDQISEDVCLAQAWLGHIFFVLFFGSLFVKGYRIQKIFTKKRINMHKAITDKDLLLLLVKLCFPVVIVLAVWTGLDPPKPTEVASDMPGHFHCVCVSKNGSYSCVLLVYEGLLVLWGVFIAKETWYVPNPFNESRLIAATLYNLAFVCLVMGALEIVLRKEPDTLFVFRSCAQWLVIGSTCTLAFVPMVLKKGLESSAQAESSQDSVNVHV